MGTVVIIAIAIMFMVWVARTCFRVGRWTINLFRERW